MRVFINKSAIEQYDSGMIIVAAHDIKQANNLIEKKQHYFFDLTKTEESGDLLSIRDIPRVIDCNVFSD